VDAIARFGRLLDQVIAAGGLLLIVGTAPPVLLHAVPQRLPSRVSASENLHRAATVIVKPLNALLVRRHMISENHGWLLCKGAAETMTATETHLTRSVPTEQMRHLRRRVLATRQPVSPICFCAAQRIVLG